MTSRAPQRLGALAQQREITVVDECPAAPAAGRLADDARALEMGERARDGWPGKAERLRCLRNGDERLGLEKLVEAQRGRGGTPEAFRKRIAHEVPMYKEIIDKAGLKIQ